MDRDRAVDVLRKAGLSLEAAWLEAFAPSADEMQQYDRENEGNESGFRSPEETDADYVRRIGFLVMAWRRAKNATTADERELANSWHAIETLFAIKRPYMLESEPWELRPDWRFDEEDDDEPEDAIEGSR